MTAREYAAAFITTVHHTYLSTVKKIICWLHTCAARLLPVVVERSTVNKHTADCYFAIAVSVSVHDASSAASLASRRIDSLSSV